MEKKKILIVSYAFYPGNSPRSHRATELAKEFSHQAHEVTVITPINNDVHPAFARKYRITIRDLGTPSWKSPDFGKSKIGYFLTRAFARLLLLAFEYPAVELMLLVAKTLKKEVGYDLLISIAVPYPVHWGVALVWKRNQNIAQKWIADCGDPYMGNTIDSFKKWFYFGWIEKWFMRKADFITIPIESARNAYFTEFHDKIKIIPQGFQFNDLKLSKTYVPNAVPTFSYAGGFIQGIRDPRPFLDYLAKIKIDFRFIIFTNNRSLIEDYLKILKGKLEIRDYVAREDLLDILVGMDFLVNFDNNSTIALPSKLIDYAICRRPVLNITNNFNSEVIEQFLAGNYQSALINDNVDQYKIENVTDSFLLLCRK